MADLSRRRPEARERLFQTYERGNEHDRRMLREALCMLGTQLGIAIPIRQQMRNVSVAQEVSTRIVDLLNKGNERAWKFFGQQGNCQNFLRRLESHSSKIGGVEARQEFAALTSMLQGTQNAVLAAGGQKTRIRVDAPYSRPGVRSSMHGAYPKNQSSLLSQPQVERKIRQGQFELAPGFIDPLTGTPTQRGWQILIAQEKKREAKRIREENRFIQTTVQRGTPQAGRYGGGSSSRQLVDMMRHRMRTQEAMMRDPQVRARLLEEAIRQHKLALNARGVIEVATPYGPVKVAKQMILQVQNVSPLVKIPTRNGTLDIPKWVYQDRERLTDYLHKNYERDPRVRELVTYYQGKKLRELPVKSTQFRSQQTLFDVVNYHKGTARPVYSSGRAPVLTGGREYKLTQAQEHLAKASRGAYFRAVGENLKGGAIKESIRFGKSLGVHADPSQLLRLLVQEKGLKGLPELERKALQVGSNFSARDQEYRRMARQFMQRHGNRPLDVAAYKKFLQLVKMKQKRGPGEVIMPFGKYGVTGQGKHGAMTIEQVLNVRGGGAYYLAAVHDSDWVRKRFPTFWAYLDRFIDQPSIRPLIERYTAEGGRASPRDLQPYFNPYKPETQEHGITIRWSDIPHGEGSFGPSYDIHEPAARHWENAPKFAFYRRERGIDRDMTSLELFNAYHRAGRHRGFPYLSGSLYMFGPPNTLGHLYKYRRLEQRYHKNPEETREFNRSQARAEFNRVVFGHTPVEEHYRSLMRTLSSRPRLEMESDTESGQIIRRYRRQQIAYPAWDAKTGKFLMKRGNPYAGLGAMYRQSMALLQASGMLGIMGGESPQLPNRYGDINKAYEEHEAFEKFQFLQRSLAGEVDISDWNAGLFGPDLGGGSGRKSGTRSRARRRPDYSYEERLPEAGGPGGWQEMSWLADVSRGEENMYTKRKRRPYYGERLSEAEAEHQENLFKKLNFGKRLAKAETLEELQDLVEDIHEFVPFNLIQKFEYQTSDKKSASLEEYRRASFSGPSAFELDAFGTKGKFLEDDTVLGQIYRRRALIIATMRQNKQI